MLYVFHVDMGSMMTFDMSLALESVSNLKEYVEKACKIPADKQVLLVSGGECLDENARVCSYSAGTDTNPIYLFSKSVIESDNPPTPSVESGLDFDLTRKVKEAQDLPASYSTVALRAQLAQSCHELSKEQFKVCEKLVLDQHLQQQGWAAVIANLEDLSVEFNKRAEQIEKSFGDYMTDRDKYLQFLQHFNEDLETLSKIPLLPTLVEAEKNQSTPKTLLEWISAADNNSSMKQLFEHCSKGLEQFDEKVFNALHTEVQNAMEAAERSNMKEVKGLGDRLFGLEQLMSEARRYLQEQADLAQSFQQNQSRASNLGDLSILPDLCASHRKQLLVMLHNYQQLCDIRRRCTRAKDELSINLYHRLRWVMYVENLMLGTDHKLVIYHDNLRRLRRHLEILQQIHLAPATYLAAVAEVVRRRVFSEAFLSWASELACHLLTIHNDEVAKRKDFQVQFEGHFLNSLFSGMDDLPPAFATQAPSIFDSSLPKITVDDMEQLKQQLPELTANFILPDAQQIANLFMIKSVKNEAGDDRGVEEKLVEVINEVGLASNLDHNLLKPADSEACVTAHGVPHLKDLDKGCESETDTEEFEKVGQSPLELHFDKDIPSPRPGVHDVATLTEDNLQTSRTEQDRLKALLVKMALLARQAILQLRVELSDMKNFFGTEITDLEQQYESLNNSWESLNIEKENKEREVIERLTVDHQLEIGDCKKLSENKSAEINALRNEITCLENSLKTTSAENYDLKSEIDAVNQNHGKEIQDLNEKIALLEAERERAVKDVSETLIRDHKAEIENIRARFRLMAITKMERSPSDSSLEKIERIDLTNQESIILQIKENLEVESEKNIKEAVEEESQKWKKLLQDKVDEIAVKFEKEKDALMEESNKRITFLRERENSLNLECLKYKSIIQQLTEHDNDSSDLIDKIENLEREKFQLENALSSERAKRLDEMGTSVSILDGKHDGSGSKKKEKLTNSQTSLIQSGKLCLDSCNVGDSVLVVWDAAHNNYKILQDSNCLYFLHTDSLETLGLTLEDNENRKIYCPAKVMHREYCHAKKDENRYNVPKGTKFYRIRVKQIRRPVACPDHGQMSVSQTTERVTDTATDAASYSLPLTPTKTDMMESSVCAVASENR